MITGICNVCGKAGAVYTCQLCGRQVCQLHYNHEKGVCLSCGRGKW